MKKVHAPIRTVLTAAIVPFAAIAAPQAALATGISAGTLIQNTASATYTSGSASGSITSNTVTIKVDELLNDAVASLNGGPISGGSAPVTLSYTVTNSGNGPEAFNLTANPAVAGNPFDLTVQTVAIDSNGNGVYDVGVDQVIPNGSASPVLAADASLTVFVIATLPANAVDGQTSQLRLTADAVTGTGTPGTSFAGQGDGGGDAVVGTSTASQFAQGSVTASLATVSLVKSAAIADPFGGTQPVPGAIVTYSIVASVAGSGSAQALHVTDIIPAGTTYQPGTLKLGATALTDAVDADNGTASASGIDVNLGTVNGGSSQTVSFAVKIN
jgi:uncharacterized repeat protein (TIGR01451 family)